MTALAVIGTLVSGVVGAVGSIVQGQAAADAANYQAAIDDRNARMIRQQTDADVNDKMRENRRNLATIRAAYGSSGLAMDGSPLDVLEDHALEAELDVERIKYTGAAKAQGMNESAQLNRMKASNASTAGMFNAVSSLVGAGTGVGRTLMRAA